MRPYAIHWFRRDLRVDGHPGLAASLRETGGRVLGLFLFDSRFLGRDDFSANRFAFFLETLRALRDALRRRGGDLLVLDAGPDEGFERVLAALRAAGAGAPAFVGFGRDYEPFARARDQRVAARLGELGVPARDHRDHLLFEPWEILPQSGQGPYRQFAPFRARWREALATGTGASRIRVAEGRTPPFRLGWGDLLGARIPPDALERFRADNAPRVDVPIPRAGEEAARRCALAFRPKLGAYHAARDLPAARGTSCLSVFLKNGSFTLAQAVSLLGLDPRDDAPGPSKFLDELAWREFAIHLLWHAPRVETEAFQPAFRGFAWDESPELWAAWREGRTGYPIVDAGMRQLARTGWMHNRVRMIVASFLAKDLLLDYRRGERFFMNRLLDGDLGPNNAGWQWAASTGADAPPYFRIFNPTLQGRRFDPDGAYVRTWMPELADRKGAAIHDPVAPVVDHAERRARALARFRAAAGGA